MGKNTQANMQTKLNEYTKHIDAETLRRIVNVDHLIAIPKGQWIVAEGEAFFLLSGIIRGFYLDKDGNDITHHFVLENQTFGSDFFTTDKPLVCSYEALEDCAALSINTAELKRIMPSNKDLMWLYIHMLEEALKQKTAREISFVSKTAIERYIDFMQANPGIEERVSQKHIASYLGITPVSLSRIRRVIRS